jgi:hypothetical protein
MEHETWIDPDQVKLRKPTRFVHAKSAAMFVDPVVQIKKKRQRRNAARAYKNNSKRKPVIKKVKINSPDIFM